MLKTGILNPQINSLLGRVRHTNTLVIADRGFPFWPMIETVDISLGGRCADRAGGVAGAAPEFPDRQGLDGAGVFGT